MQEYGKVQNNLPGDFTESQATCTLQHKKKNKAAENKEKVSGLEKRIKRLLLIIGIFLFLGDTAREKRAYNGVQLPEGARRADCS